MPSFHSECSRLLVSTENSGGHPWPLLPSVQAALCSCHPESFHESSKDTPREKVGIIWSTCALNRYIVAPHGKSHCHGVGEVCGEMVVVMTSGQLY